MLELLQPIASELATALCTLIAAAVKRSFDKWKMKKDLEKMSKLEFEKKYL